MKRRTRWVLGLTTFGAPAAVALAVLLWPGDQKRLQGAWVASGTRLTIAGDRLRFCLPLPGHDYPAEGMILDLRRE